MNNLEKVARSIEKKADTVVGLLYQAHVALGHQLDKAKKGQKFDDRDIHFLQSIIGNLKEVIEKTK